MKESNYLNFSTEIMYMIFSLLNPRERFCLGRTCRRFYLIYHNEYIVINPKKYIFYRRNNDAKIDLFEFTEIKVTSKTKKIIFHKKHTTCDQCILKDNCDEMDSHKPIIKHLKMNDLGMICCGSPRTGGRKYVHAIERSKVQDLYKDECEKCNLMKICKKCYVIDGKCRVSRCPRRHTLLGNIFDVWSFESKHYIHRHRLCCECFKGIDKNVSINLQIS